MSEPGANLRTPWAAPADPLPVVPLGRRVLTVHYDVLAGGLLRLPRAYRIVQVRPRALHRLSDHGWAAPDEPPEVQLILEGPGLPAMDGPGLPPVTLTGLGSAETQLYLNGERLA